MRSGLILLAIPTVLVLGTIACSSDDPSEPGTTPEAGTGADTSTAPDSAKEDAAISPDASSSADADSGTPSTVPQVVAYAYLENAGAAETTPVGQYAYNATDGEIKIKRTGTGLYEATFAGLTLDGGIPAVTAYGTSSTLCHWSGTSGSTVSVRCVDNAGSNADSKFVLTMFDKGTIKSATILGFAHANDKSSASYTPQASRSNNVLGGGAITATRSAAGTYAIQFGGLSATDIGSVQVTPYGNESANCVIFSWVGNTVNVRCYDTTAVLADSQYLIMLTGLKAGGAIKVVGHAHAADKANATYTPSRTYNQGGGAITATRSGAGTYAIAFDGQNLNNGAHVQLGAEAQARRCNVGAWAGTTTNVTCASGGSKSDNNYAILLFQ